MKNSICKVKPSTLRLLFQAVELVSVPVYRFSIALLFSRTHRNQLDCGVCFRKSQCCRSVDLLRFGVADHVALQSVRLPLKIHSKIQRHSQETTLYVKLIWRRSHRSCSDTPAVKDEREKYVLRRRERTKGEGTTAARLCPDLPTGSWNLACLRRISGDASAVKEMTLIHDDAMKKKRV